MSFNINGPQNKPMIQESQNMQNNGGGGNLGYFKRGKKKDEEKEVDEEITDYFIRETNDKEGDPDKQEGQKEGFFDKLKNKVKEKFLTQDEHKEQ